MGIGASAGGLEAFTQLLGHLPATSGLSFVLVQHLDPTHESILPSLLARATAMPVREAQDGVLLRPDEVHVIPAERDIAVADGQLRLVPRPARRGPHMPLDFFLGTLAQAQGSRAIAVILSGTGSDGTLGCKAVKAAGGIAIAQDPASAKYDGMPKSAIAAGCVDFVLPPEGIAREIVRLARDPYLRVPREEEAPPVLDEKGHLQRIFGLLKRVTRADFSCYKKTTLMRRIRRRMVLHKTEQLAEYVERLEAELSEVHALHQDLLINVTSFFRDPETFQALARGVFPRILGGRSAEMPVRVWVPGCATGEEAYSVTMSLLESLSDLPSNPPLQVFATDLSDTAIEKARAGVYLESIAADVSPARLLRFFVKVDGHYHVSRAVRDLIVFARQDVARDPPFSRMDLVSCRNVLIYLEPSLQKKVLATFHYALSAAGFLLLGKSETTGASSELFQVVDKEHKVYAKLASAAPFVPSWPAAAPTGEGSAREGSRLAPPVSNAERRSDVEKEVQRLLLSRYAPASVLVDERGQVIHFRGDTETYLGHVQGAASLHLTTMARKGIASELSVLLQEAGATDAPQRKRGLLFRHRGRSKRVDLEVVPVKGPASGERCFLVLFETGGERRTEAPPLSLPRGEKAKQRRLAELEQELLALRHYQHAVEEEQAASNEELQSANEEILSSNEELQSLNEEMETAKEELQSSNEELTTLNEELQNRNLELQRLNDDVDNFLASTHLSTLMLGPDLLLRRFTPAAAKLLNIIPADVGRPLGHLRMEGIEVPELDSLALGVIDTLRPVERELQDREGRWWRLHVRPYRTRGNKTEGAVLVLLDIDHLKRSQQFTEEARDFANAVVDTAREPLLVLDGELRVRRANRSFYELFQMSPQVVEGRLLYEMGGGEWDSPALRALLEAVLPRDRSFQDCELEHDSPSLGRRTLKVNGRKLRQEAGRDERILLAVEDVTKAARAEEERTQLLRRTNEAAGAAEAASRLKDEFVAVASHELRGPLNAMVGWVHLLTGGSLDQATADRALAAIDRSVKAQTRLIDELLDVTQLATGKLRLSARLVEILPIVEAALANARLAVLAKGIELGLGTGITAELVRGDADRLQQVVWNLLSNAIKFTPKGGRVEVWTGRSGTHVQIKVTDTGTGIAADFLPHIFERFRQADSTASRKQPGLGLGLAIVRELVELHGGRVTAESRGDGQGSTFVVWLPIPPLRAEPPSMEKAEEIPAAKAAVTPEPSLLGGLRVLVVEDDPDGRDVLKTVLERYGARVQAVGSVTEALAAFAREAPEFLVSDIGLADRDGYDLMREIRKLSPDRGGRIPALALTAYAAVEDRQRAAAAGYQEYMAKPAEPAELVARVAALVARTR